MAQKSSGTKKRPHEEFAEQITTMLAQGVAPWQKSWKAGEYYAPFNPASGTIYRGINRLMLTNPNMADPRRMTFKQAQDKGYRVKAGSKATPVEFWLWTQEVDRTDDDGNIIYGPDGKPEKETIKLERPRVFYSKVFHASQLETQDREPIPAYEPPPLEWNPHEKAEAIIKSSSVLIHHDQRDRAFYSPMRDEIHLPYRENFVTAGDYYNTALHELGHWACSKRRLDMEGGAFGSESYASEELRVEIFSWMICQDLGLDFEPENSLAYVDHWMQHIKKAPYEIVRACRDAEKIKKYVLGLELGLTQDGPFIFTGQDAVSAAPEMPAFKQTQNASSIPNIEVERLSGDDLRRYNLANPGDFQFQYPRFDDLPGEAGPEVLGQLSQAYQDATDQVALCLDEELSAHLSLENRRIILASAVMDLDALHRQMQSQGLIASEVKSPYLDRADLLAGHSTDVSEPRLALENLVKPEAFQFQYPLYASVNHNSPPEDKLRLLKAYSSALELFSLSSDEHRVGDLDPQIQRNVVASTLLDLTMLHNQANEIGLLSENEPLPFVFSDIPPLANEPLGQSPAERLAKIIERSAMKCAVANDYESLSLALLTTAHVTRKAMESPDYNAPGAEAESALLSLINYEAERCGYPENSEEVMEAFKFQIVTLGHIQGQRMDSAYSGLYQQALQNYAEVYELDQGEMALRTGASVPLKQNFDGGRLDWALNSVTFDILCRENEHSPWHEPTDEENKTLENAGELKLAPVIILESGAFLTYDGQVHKSSKALESTAEKQNTAKEAVYLQVPYKEKNQAKALGAKWDAKAKLWMAPIGADLSKLAQWMPEREPEPSPTISPENELRQVMSEAGLRPTGSLIMDGSIQRVPVEGGKPGSRDGAYSAHIDGVPNGWVMNHKTGQHTKWVANGHTLSPEQTAQLKAEVENRRRQREAEREKGYQEAAGRAFDKLFAPGVKPASSEHPYLKSKDVVSYGIYEDQRGNLLIEGLDLSRYQCVGKGPNPPESANDLEAQRIVQTVQTITPDGRKIFEPGAKKTGAAFLFGEDKLKKIAFNQWRERRNPEPLLTGLDTSARPEILLAEGYATASTIYKATGLPVAVAFDAGNLKPVAEALKKQFPGADIVVCADNDHANKVNVGVEKAQAAAQAVGGRVLIPEFTDEEKAQGLTDFNDLAKSRGLLPLIKMMNVRGRDDRQPDLPKSQKNDGLSR